MKVRYRKRIKKELESFILLKGSKKISNSKLTTNFGLKLRKIKDGN